MVEAEEREDIAEKKADPPKKRSFFKWIIIVFVILAVSAAGFLGFKYYRDFTSKGPVKAEVKTELADVLWSMGSVIVNLMDNDGSRYLKANIQIEMSGKDAVADIEVIKPKVMDSILDLLSSKSYKEIIGYEGKQRLRDEIAVRVNNNLSIGQVRKVYFTEFIIQ